MKRFVIEMEDELHKKMKMKALENDKSAKNYVTELIEKDLDTKKE